MKWRAGLYSRRTTIFIVDRARFDSEQDAKAYAQERIHSVGLTEDELVGWGPDEMDAPVVFMDADGTEYDGHFDEDGYARMAGEGDEVC